MMKCPSICVQKSKKSHKRNSLCHLQLCTKTPKNLKFSIAAVHRRSPGSPPPSMANPPSKTQSPPPFFIPVDADQKATEFRPLSLSSPHMRAFHLAWLSLFACFFSTFSIPPLLPIIRQDLKLTSTDIGNAGIASFAGSIFSRLAMGPVCDLVGPRIASATLSLITAPVLLSALFISTPLSFILLRFLIGFCLANFVANQFWMSSMFSGYTVGLANGVAAGWANVGAGFTQLVMPLIFTFITSCGAQPFTAWRIAFIFPAIFQAVTAVMVLSFGQDLPVGNYTRSSYHDGDTEKAFMILLNGVRNYRGWILGLLYGLAFGVELTIDNIIAEYFYDRFNVDIKTAGMLAASFGLANFVSRPTGGVVSDVLGRKYGMRGRLWGLWVVQTMAGLLCLLLGRANSLWGSVMVMCCFSLFVQAASGLIFGVVPFVSKRSLGVISGMTGSGGTVGSVVTQKLLFSGSNRFATQTGISLMGIMMLVCTLPVSLIYFPDSGGMLCGPSVHDDHYHPLNSI